MTINNFKSLSRKNKIKFILSKHPNLRNIPEDNYFLFRDYLISEYSQMDVEEINIEYEFYKYHSMVDMNN